MPGDVKQGNSKVGGNLTGQKTVRPWSSNMVVVAGKNNTSAVEYYSDNHKLRSNAMWRSNNINNGITSIDGLH